MKYIHTFVYDVFRVFFGNDLGSLVFLLMWADEQGYKERKLDYWHGEKVHLRLREVFGVFLEATKCIYTSPKSYIASEILHIVRRSYHMAWPEHLKVFWISIFSLMFIIWLKVKYSRKRGQVRFSGRPWPYLLHHFKMDTLQENSCDFSISKTRGKIC